MLHLITIVFTLTLRDVLVRPWAILILLCCFIPSPLQSRPQRRRGDPVGQRQGQGVSVGTRSSGIVPRWQLHRLHWNKSHTTRRGQVDHNHWPCPGPRRGVGQEGLRMHPPAQPGTDLWHQGRRCRWWICAGRAGESHGLEACGVYFVNVSD